MANGIYKVTEDFEKALGDYTGAPYVVTVDNQSNALFLALMYERVAYRPRSNAQNTMSIATMRTTTSTFFGRPRPTLPSCYPGSFVGLIGLASAD